MPIIKFKDKKKSNSKIKNEVETSVEHGEDEYMRRISLPVNDEIIGEAEVGSTVVVTLIGEVVGARSDKQENYSEKSITVLAKSIEVYEKGDDEDAGMEEGYRGA